MAHIRIDNRELEVKEGIPVLKAARDAGYIIPSLCHDDNLPHYTSCMLCMVRDNRTKSYFASCSVMVQEGMDLDVSSEQVIALRKKSLELLFSEHRAECEAPCRTVCPAGYNIPLYNRYISAGEFGKAAELTLSETGGSRLACFDCAAYCENACRRKKIDLPVSIRNLKIFSINNLAVGSDRSKLHPGKPPKRFSSLTGRLEAGEQEVWLKEAKPGAVRSREISSLDDAGSEAGSCMHCDCRAAGDCSLRELAESFSLKDPRGKIINAPIEKKINRKTGLIFENSKCIKCGLCVRLCESYGEEPALCFISRGFVSIISEPLTTGFEDVLTTRSREVIEICPTGALSNFNE